MASKHVRLTFINNSQHLVLLNNETLLKQSAFFFVHRSKSKNRNITFRKPAVLPSSGEEAPNLVDPLDQTVLGYWVPQKHSTC